MLHFAGRGTATMFFRTAELTYYILALGETMREGSNSIILGYMFNTRTVDQSLALLVIRADRVDTEAKR